MTALLLTTAVAAPLISLVALAAAAWLHRRVGESLVTAVVVGTFGVSCAAVAVLGARLATGTPGGGPDIGRWWPVGSDPLPLVADGASAPFALTVGTLVLLVALFSRRYLHRDPGYLRFHLLLTGFGLGALVVALAGSLALAVVGWEIAGTTSVLLIGYFSERRGPVESALHVFTVYRVADLGLLTAVVYWHHVTPDGPRSVTDATVLGAALLWAAMGKGALLPWCGWLPRAMEGPTPSSAICYGAVSVSLAPYLLLRSSPAWAESAAVGWAIVAVGAATAVHATVVGRAQTDVKSALAYASLTQIALVTCEVGLGWHRLALAHLIGHAILRGAQLLRAPSRLHDHQVHERALGRPAPPARNRAHRLLPARTQLWAYRYALHRGDLDARWERLLDHAGAGLRSLDRLDERWRRLLVSRPAGLARPVRGAGR
ncbi:proton-conducting transporter membrane subunit [Pilimelia columellifera]|uniref:Proton-conducting transporter membrane subunit n=1 Tax=Pilimelia columellifera subsp. columellifera TaxID=706583 RepID=A0ABP6AVM8_9ACTN